MNATARLLATAAAWLLAVPMAANAVPISGTYNFSVSGFENSPGADPVVGSFDIAFDNDFNYWDQTAGFTLNSINIAVVPSGFNYWSASDELIIGGLDATVSTCCNISGDWTMVIDNFSTAPTLQFFFTRAVGPEIMGAFSNTGQITRVTTVPEPATLALFGLTLAGLGLMRRRRAVS